MFTVPSGARCNKAEREAYHRNEPARPLAEGGNEAIAGRRVPLFIGVAISIHLLVKGRAR